MATEQQLEALTKCYQAAKASGHIFPEAAACEAAVETGWFQSKLYLQASNIFGLKQSVVPRFETISLLTREYIHNVWITVNAQWIKYPSLSDSFKDRMATLERLAPEYMHYKFALNAKTPEEYLTEVSKTWSTDPKRALTCISILHEHKDAFHD